MKNKQLLDGQIHNPHRRRATLHYRDRSALLDVALVDNSPGRVSSSPVVRLDRVLGSGGFERAAIMGAPAAAVPPSTPSLFPLPCISLPPSPLLSFPPLLSGDGRMSRSRVLWSVSSSMPLERLRLWSRDGTTDHRACASVRRAAVVGRRVHGQRVS